jgi:probable phosphoglycerate mutase
VLAHYLGVHIDLFQRIMISPASISALHLAKNGMVRVGRINDDGPLKPPPLPLLKTKEKKNTEKERIKAENDETAVSTSNDSGATSAE